MSFQRVIRTSQPQSSVGVDWGNPISRGLVVANVGNSRRNLVNGADQIEGGDWPSVATPGGVAALSTSNIRGRYWTTPLSGSNGSTIFAVGIGQSTASASCYGAWNGASGSNIGYLLAIDAGSFWLYNLPGYIGRSTTRPADGSVFTCAAVNQPGASDVQGWLNGRRFATPLISTVTNLGRAGPAEIITSQSAQKSGANLLFLAFSRALSDAEIASISANPWQLFAPIARPIFVPVSVAVSIYRPSADLNANGWTATPGGTLASCIDEVAADDNDFITSPDLSSAATLSLSAALPAGSWDVRVRAARTATGGQIRVRFLNSSSVDVGGTAWQALSALPTTYTLAATTTGTADRFRIEVQP